MTHPESKHRPIEFSGTIQELAHTLGMRADEIIASITGLIRAGHLERVSGATWVLRPARRSIAARSKLYRADTARVA
jgi:hypothetical protein